MLKGFRKAPDFRKIAQTDVMIYGVYRSLRMYNKLQFRGLCKKSASEKKEIVNEKY